MNKGITLNQLLSRFSCQFPSLKISVEAEPSEKYPFGTTVIFIYNESYNNINSVNHTVYDTAFNARAITDLANKLLAMEEVDNNDNEIRIKLNNYLRIAMETLITVKK